MKKSATKIPTIKQIADSCQCLTIEGAPSEVLKSIIQRQHLAEEGKALELIIHAEGGTTNGNMISFKKGAFASLLSIRPKAVKYNTFGMTSPSSGILDGISHHVLILTNLICVLEIYEMPIFRPN